MADSHEQKVERAAVRIFEAVALCTWATTTDLRRANFRRLAEDVLLEAGLYLGPLKAPEAGDVVLTRSLRARGRGGASGPAEA